jgi:hypothetical protein
MYPDHEWLPWMFHKAPQGFWSEQKNVRAYLEWLGKTLQFHQMSDWYSVSPAIFKQNFGSYALLYQGFGNLYGNA